MSDLEARALDLFDEYVELAPPQRSAALARLQAMVDAVAVPPKARSLAKKIADDLRRRKSIMGIFDEGCMGMYNAIIPDELLFPTGVYKERLSQSALYYGATQVTDAEAKASSWPAGL